MLQAIRRPSMTLNDPQCSTTTPQSAGTTLTEYFGSHSSKLQNAIRISISEQKCTDNLRHNRRGTRTPVPPLMSTSVRPRGSSKMQYVSAFWSLNDQITRDTKVREVTLRGEVSRTLVPPLLSTSVRPLGSTWELQNAIRMSILAQKMRR